MTFQPVSTSGIERPAPRWQKASKAAASVGQPTAFGGIGRLRGSTT